MIILRQKKHAAFVLYVFLCMYYIFFIWLLGGQLWWACALSGSLVAFSQMNIVVVVYGDYCVVSRMFEAAPVRRPQ